MLIASATNERPDTDENRKGGAGPPFFLSVIKGNGFIARLGKRAKTRS